MNKNRMATRKSGALLAGFVGVVIAGMTPAQEPPDAGQTLEQLRTAPELRPESPDFRLELPRDGQVEPGGEEVEIRVLDIEGNTVFDRQALLSVMQMPEGQSYDLAGLQGLAHAVSDHYRANGYPFARAIIPPQGLADGELRMVVVEGRYGAIRIRDEDEQRARQADAFVDGLESGALIEADTLERTTLIIEDLPGIRVLPILRPGEVVGTGDLDFVIEPEERFSGQVKVDNHGNRYTGYERLSASAVIASPFRLGDQISLSGMVSRDDLLLGSVNYSRPLGSEGWRFNTSYTYTEYELAREFDGLGFGDAHVLAVGATYPVRRSQNVNVTLNLNVQYKDLRNERLEGALVEDYSSVALPLTLLFDRRDEWFGGGVTYGSVSLNPGDMRLSDEMREADVLGTDGQFVTVNLDLARIQSIAERLGFFIRASGQWADDNLDSSEGISLGGAERVRAYPASEASGDLGGFVQAELRYQGRLVAPYLFADAGWVKFQVSPLAEEDDNTRSLSGAGVGFRVQQNPGFQIDAAVAWRLSGGEPQSDTRDRDPLYWLSASYNF